jgi:hypothetical protein
MRKPRRNHSAALKARVYPRRSPPNETVPIDICREEPDERAALYSTRMAGRGPKADIRTEQNETPPKRGLQHLLVTD